MSLFESLHELGNEQVAWFSHRDSGADATVNERAMQLESRGILYAPDYAINVGGLMNVAEELVVTAKRARAGWHWPFWFGGPCKFAHCKKICEGAGPMNVGF